MPGLLFLRNMYRRYKRVEEEIQKDKPVRNGRVMPVEASDFDEKSALYLQKEAQYGMHYYKKKRTGNFITGKRTC